MAVARLCSFSAAAAELGYTQAAVSQQIAALENDLKTQLLTRRPVAPTEAGTRLLEHAEPILLRLDAARADVTRMTRTPAATLTIGVTPFGRRDLHPRHGPGGTAYRDAPPGNHGPDSDPPANSGHSSARRVRPGPDRRPSSPWRPSPRAGPGNRHRPQRGKRHGGAASRPSTGSEKVPPPAGPSGRPMDSSRQRGAITRRDQQARRHGGLQASIPIYRERRNNAAQPSDYGPRPNPATREGAKHQRHHQRPDSPAKTLPPRGADPRGPPKAFAGGRPSGTLVWTASGTRQKGQSPNGARRQPPAISSCGGLSAETLHYAELGSHDPGACRGGDRRVQLRELLGDRAG